MPSEKVSSQSGHIACSWWHPWDCQGHLCFSTSGAMTSNPYHPEKPTQNINSLALDKCGSNFKRLTLQSRHNEGDCVSNNRRLDWLLSRLVRLRSKKASKLLLAFVRGIHRWPVDSHNKRPVTRKMIPSDDVIMFIIKFMYISCEITLRWMSQIMIRQHCLRSCPQATNHYLSQCWHRYMSPYVITRP